MSTGIRAYHAAAEKAEDARSAVRGIILDTLRVGLLTDYPTATEIILEREGDIDEDSYFVVTGLMSSDGEDEVELAGPEIGEHSIEGATVDQWIEWFQKHGGMDGHYQPSDSITLT